MKDYVFQGAPSGVVSPGTTLAPADGIDTINGVSYLNTGNGWVPLGGSIVAKVDKTAQAANISSATLFAVPENMGGSYRLSAIISVTTVDAVSSTMPKVQFGYTDAESSQVQALDATATSAGNVLTTFAQSDTIVNAKAGTNITYDTASYASNTAGQMKYAVHIRVQYLG